MTVFLLQHTHEWDDGHEDVKLIGVYSSAAKAQEGLASVRDQPGFLESPDRFSIDEEVVDRTSWAEGYVTVAPHAEGSSPGNADSDANRFADPDEEPVWFEFSATLRVSGDDIDIDGISRTLGLEPTHTHRKGHQRSATAEPWKQDMWSYTAATGGTEPLENHIMALWDAIRPNVEYLRQLKTRHHVDVFCGYRSNSGTAGFEVGPRCFGLFAELEVPFRVSVIVS